MEQKKFLIWWIFALTVLFTVHAQETVQNQENEVFAPFVSQLEGEIRNNLIRLSWQDARDIRGAVYIYRSETSFSTLLVLPTPAEVPYGTGSYLDEVENPGIIYYLVAASDEYGRKYILPILNTNTLSVTVGPENVPGNTARQNQNARLAPAQPNAPLPGIEEMNVRIDEDRVIINFSGADREKNLILYRSLNPIRRQEDLLSALIIRQKASSPVIDYPVPGLNYYYALIYEEDLANGIFSLRSGYNVTDAVQIQSTAGTGSREMPLPGLNLSASHGGSSSALDGLPGFVTESFGFDTETVFVLPERRNEKTSKKETEIFSEDLVKGGIGEEYQLRSIVQGYFSLKEWNKAAEEFRRFLDLPRNKDNKARAQFYLGQVYYFQGRPREALFQFLVAQEQYPNNCSSWIQAVLGDFTR
ncbi:MAG: hypothetical protein FWG29_07680 [Treponema sp.]|jgi:tetratricopeptide (TPR) repeat protein|nr:hypothetical protein [Treponema sp.]